MTIIPAKDLTIENLKNLKDSKQDVQIYIDNVVSSLAFRKLIENAIIRMMHHAVHHATNFLNRKEACISIYAGDYGIAVGVTADPIGHALRTAISNVLNQELAPYGYTVSMKEYDVYKISWE